MSQGGGAEADEEGGEVDGDDWWPEVEDTLVLETVGTIVLEAVSWASVEPSYDWWVHGLAPLRVVCVPVGRLAQGVIVVAVPGAAGSGPARKRPAIGEAALKVARATVAVTAVGDERSGFGAEAIAELGKTRVALLSLPEDKVMEFAPITPEAYEADFVFVSEAKESVEPWGAALGRLLATRFKGDAAFATGDEGSVVAGGGAVGSSGAGASVGKAGGGPSLTPKKLAFHRLEDLEKEMAALRAELKASRGSGGGGSTPGSAAPAGRRAGAPPLFGARSKAPGAPAPAALGAAVGAAESQAAAGAAAGLAPDVVASAVAAGISLDQVLQLGALFKGAPSRIGAEPAVAAARERKVTATADTVDDEEEVIGAGAGGGEAPLAAEPSVLGVMKQLADITGQLAKGKVPRDPLERALTTLTLGATAAGEDGEERRVSTRMGVEAMMLLRRAVAERPEALTKVILENVARQNATGTINVSGSLPSETVPSIPFYLEHRSLIDGHRPTIYSAWLMAQVVDLLLRGRTKEAICRGLLAVSALEQMSIDRGNWTTAWEMTLNEQEPPFAAFSGHSTVGLRRPFSQMYDRRWHEAVLAAVNADEEMRERRKKLSAWTNPEAPRAREKATADGTAEEGQRAAGANPRRRGAGPKAAGGAPKAAEER